MKCPHITKLTQIAKNVYKYDDETNLNTTHEHKLVSTHEMAECLLDECACWDKTKQICTCGGL
jgi:hypothetical protein